MPENRFMRKMFFAQSLGLKNGGKSFSVEKFELPMAGSYFRPLLTTRAEPLNGGSIRSEPFDWLPEAVLESR